MSSPFFAQQSSNSSLQQNQHIDIIRVYEKVVEDGYTSIQIYETLAQSNYERGNYTDAKKWFEKWFKEENPEKVDYLKYLKTLRVLNELKNSKH